MKLKIFFVISLSLSLIACSDNLIQAMTEAELEKLVQAQQEEIAGLEKKIADLTLQLDTQKELYLQDSNQKRNQNIRSLFSKE